MTEAQYGHNHQINPTTGFLENPAYIHAFDSDKKLRFLEHYKANGLSFYDTCAALGIRYETVNKHYQMDPVFKKAFDEAEKEYADRLQGVSRRNALNPKSVIERIFQLKALFPGKYSDQKSTGNLVVNMVFDEKLVQQMKEREKAIDVQPLSDGDSPQ